MDGWEGTYAFIVSNSIAETPSVSCVPICISDVWEHPFPQGIDHRTYWQPFLFVLAIRYIYFCVVYLLICCTVVMTMDIPDLRCPLSLPIKPNAVFWVEIFFNVKYLYTSILWRFIRFFNKHFSFFYKWYLGRSIVLF